MSTNTRNAASGLSYCGLIFLVLCLAVTALFVVRQIPLTSDDDFYLEYFSEFRDFGDTLILAIVDEPLFKVVTNLLYRVLTPEINVRVLICLTILPHIFVAYRLSGWRSWAYIGGYFLFVELAPHLSWVQLRQGFAVGLLCLIFHFTRERYRVLSVFVVGLIHTSMLVLLPCFALASIRRKVVAYGLILAAAFALFALPDIVGLVGLAFGRRESVYLNEAPTYPIIYVLYCVLIAVYVTLFARDRVNSDRLLAYHAMCALVLPMFFMTTFGAFAERLFFVVRWYELTIVTQSTRAGAGRVAVGYVAMNFSYSVYHSIVNYGSGGVLDRYLQLISP